jgi:hypothetical protein
LASIGHRIGDQNPKKMYEKSAPGADFSYIFSWENFGENSAENVPPKNVGRNSAEKNVRKIGPRGQSHDRGSQRQHCKKLQSR